MHGNPPAPHAVEDVPGGRAQDQASTRKLPFVFARRHGVLVTASDPPRLLHRSDVSLVAMAEAQRVMGRTLDWQQVADADFDRVLHQLYQHEAGTASDMADQLGGRPDLTGMAGNLEEVEDLLEQHDDAPVIRFINALLGEAIAEQASDIHIETFERRLLVRFRVDGVLRRIVEPRRELAPLLVSRIKVMARMDIAEKRMPQDGRISLRIGGREVDVRVSTLPAAGGERVVLRLLDKQAGQLSLDALGLSTRDAAVLASLLERPHGILLVTGPTGSGKTTTLYASLQTIDHRRRNILTVEDPIEYQLDGIGQTQVNSRIDMTFARGLRSILRQDPDVLMVGEIRDTETARIAVQASLTGHLVLSTLHTNSAVGAVTRLLDMGVEPFLLSSSLIGVMAQRLVRRLCPDCRQARVATAAECEALGLDPLDPPVIHGAVGCTHCHYLGYRGRTGIYELVAFDADMRELIHRNSGEAALLAHARTLGGSLIDDGCRKVLQGLTTVEEVLRVGQDG